MAWTPANDDAEDRYWEEQRQRAREKVESNPHTLERWFRRSVHDHLKRQAAPGAPWLTEGLLDWYWAHRDRFLTFTNVEKYHGEGWSSGSWSIDLQIVTAWLWLAIRRDDPERQIDFILDHILPGTTAIYDRLPIPAEPSARTVLYAQSELPVKEQERRIRTLERLRDRWPRACEVCQDVFVPTTKRKARAVTTCDNCNPKKRRGTS